MDSKDPLLPHTEPDTTSTAPRPSPRRVGRFHIAAFAFVIGLCWLALSWVCPESHHKHHEEQTVGAKVPLEVHVMSKCPDTRDCLQKLVVPAMANVSDKVDFRLSFIGRPTEEDDGVHCLHGQTECLGDILELCAASEYPDPKIYLGFVMCLSRDYRKIPQKEFVQDCALEHGIDFDTLNHCMSKDDGAYGMGMLRESVTRSAKLNATTSCTVRLNGKERCIHDDGRFRSCEGGSKPDDLIRDINKLYEAGI